MAHNCDTLLIESPVADDDGHANDSEEQIRQAKLNVPVKPSDKKGDGYRAQANEEGGVVRLANLCECQHDAREKVLFAGSGGRQTQDILELVEHEQNGRSERESNDHRVRNVSRQISQA